MKDCIFCKIVKGEIPSNKIYEDEKIIGILDINPVTEGHSLVIPKKHYENIYDIPEETLSKVVKAAKTVADKMKYGLESDGVNLLQSNGRSAGQEIFHFHMHVIPRYRENPSGVGFKRDEKPKKSLEEIHEKLKE